MDAEQKILGMTIPALALSSVAGQHAILAAPAPIRKNEACSDLTPYSCIIRTTLFKNDLFFKASFVDGKLELNFHHG